MRVFWLHQCLFFVLATLVVAPSVVQAQALFSGVVSRSESLTPLPTDAEVAVQIEAEIQAQLPPPLVKQDIPQRIEQVTPQTFMILPREAPLPTGTISGGFFIEETGEAPAPLTPPPPPTPPVPDMAATPPTPAAPTNTEQAAHNQVPAAPAPVLMKNMAGEYEVVTIPPVPERAAPTPATSGSSPKPVASPAKKQAPKTQTQLLTLSYDLDFATPENSDALFALKDKLADKSVRSIQFTAVGAAPALVDYTSLVQQRTRALKVVLGVKPQTPSQTILLRYGADGTGPQQLRVRVVYEAPALAG